jgi:hypothetical protein
MPTQSNDRYRWVVQATRSFTTIIGRDRRGRVLVPLPFDPDDVWGPKPQHRVGGRVNGMGVRAVVERSGDQFAIMLGPAWRRDCGLAAGDQVQVELFAEGPQRDDLADDVRDAFARAPEAGAFFDGLAQFYRRAYLRYIDATKRRPDVRVERIAEVVDLCRRGMKERPR